MLESIGIYSYRTYSGTVMPYRVDAYTPYGYERFVTGPGYVHQRITPRGFESYYAAPSWSYRVMPYPFVYVYHYPNYYGLSAGSSPLPTPGQSITPRATGAEEAIPMPRPAQKGETYPYDGGPVHPVPMPQAEPTPGRKAGTS